MEWIVVGDIASVVQLTVTVKLIYAIVKAAKNARMHKRNCRQFAQHLKLIANLLQQLKPQDVDEFPEYRETREPLDHLEQCLKRALILVENCRDKSYLYLIAMGWSIVGQFKEFQSEIDKYLRLIPLITLVENHREKLRAIERDRRDYTLDEEEKKLYSTLLKDDRTRDDAVVLQKSLSRSYPGLGLQRALREENEKLCVELQRTQQQMDLDQCDVIEHLLEITKSVNLMSAEEREKLNIPTHSRTSTMESIDSGMSVIAGASGRVPPNSRGLPKLPHGPLAPPPHGPLALPLPPHGSLPPPPHGSLAPPPHGSLAPPHVPTGNAVTHGPSAPYVPAGYDAAHGPRAPHLPIGPAVAHGPRASHVPIGNAGHSRGTDNGPREFRKWHNGLYDCLIDPFLCISTFLYPCGTFTNIASVVSDGEMTQELACHDLAFHSLYLGCCFYTCCYRRKLRKRFSIPGGTCDDCWAHILCCCCALVQEWREIQAREEEGLRLYKTSVPSQQTMENYKPRPSPNHQERYIG